MGCIKKGMKNIKILILAAILLTTTTFAVAITIQNQNQNTNLLINAYLQSVPSNPNNIIQPKADIGTSINFSHDYTETINVIEDNIVINGNGHTVRGPGSGYGFFLNGRSNVTIFNVTVTGWEFGFFLFSSSNNNLTGNTAKNNQVGFLCLSSNNNNLTGCTAKNNVVGFFLYSSSNDNLSGNTANNNGGCGFWLFDSSYNNLTGNTAKNNGKYGFCLESSSYNNISGNTVADFWGSGIYEDPNSHDNIIENNTVTATGLPLLLSLLLYYTFYSFQQSAKFSSIILMAGLLVALITVGLIGSVVIYVRRKGAVAVKGKPSSEPKPWKSPS